MPAYVAVLRQNATGDYGVSFPDLPGCATGGSSLSEARTRASEVLSRHLEKMAEDGDAPTIPTSLERVAGALDDADAIPFLVKARDPSPRLVRVNVTLPASVLHYLDERAAQLGTTRSQFLADAAQNQIFARVILCEDDVRRLERELLRNEPTRRADVFALLRKWRHEQGLIKDPTVDHLIDKILTQPPHLAANAVDSYLASLAPLSRRGTLGALDTLARMLGHTSAVEVPWHTLKFADTSRLQARLLADGKNPDYARKLMSALRSVLRWSAKLELMTQEDFARAAALEQIRGSRVRQRKNLKPGNLEQLATVTRQDEKPLRGLRDRTLLALLAGAGLRRSEVASLLTTAFNREARTLRVVGHGNRERIVPLPLWAAEAIAEFIDTRGFADGPILCQVSQTGVALREPLSGGQAVYIVLRRLARRAGLKDIPPHAFRRNYCTQLLDSGAKLPAVQELLGVAASDPVHRLYNRRELEGLTSVVSRLPNPHTPS